MNASEVTPDTATQIAAAKAEKVPVVSMDVGDDAKILAPGTGANKKSQGAVVKKVVDADDAEQSIGDSSRDKFSGDGRSKVVNSQGKSVRALASGKPQNNDNSDLDIREARPTASGDRSLIRALGLKIGKIVIDPGHGGHDTGTIGPERAGRKRSGARCGTAFGQVAGDAAGRGSGLHAQERYVHSARNAHRDRQPGARRSVRFDSRQLESRSRRRGESRPTT